jgi:hypothetical protein
MRRPRHEDNGSPDNGKLLLIEFDKLINVLCRMWEKMFLESGLKVLDGIEGLTQEELARTVRFRPPTQELPGTHGPGQARRKPGSDDLVYMTRMAEQLVDEGFPYFAFEPRDGMASDSDKTEKAGAEGRLKSNEPHKWVVRPGLPVGDEKAFWGGDYTQAEIELIQRTAVALSLLGPTEIRAIGTHKDQQGTMQEIRRELKWARKVCARLLAALQNGRLSFGEAVRLREFAHEANRKAILNEDYYKTAYDKMLQKMLNTPLESTFQAVQKQPSVVWGHPDIKRMREKVRLAVGVAEYIYGIAYFSEHPGELEAHRGGKAAAAARHSFDDGLKSLRESGMAGIPGQLADIFEASTGLIRKTAADRLSTLLAEIKEAADGG